MRCAVVGVLVASSVAHAEVVSDERRALWAMRSTDYATLPGGSLTSFDATLDPPFTVAAQRIEDIYAHGRARADVTLGATLGSDTSGGLGASVDASYDLPICRVIGASASGQLGYADGMERAWTAGVSGCIPLPFDLLWGSYGHAENVRVSLFDRVMMRRERTSSDVFDLHVRFYRHFTERSQIDLAVFDVGGDARAYGGAKKMEMAVAHWHRHRPNGDQTFRFLQIYAQYLADEDSPDTLDTRAGKIVPFGVEGIVLAPNTAGSALVGWTRSLAYDGQRRILDENGLHVDLAVTLDVEPTFATFRARHSTLAGYGGQVVRDDRLAATLEHERERFALRGEGFVARQTVVRNTPGGRSLFTGGAAVDTAWSLNDYATLVGRIEGGRTLDAVSAMEPVTASWDVRGTVGLQAHYGVQR